MQKIIINAYEFKDLDENTQNRVLNEIIEFLLLVAKDTPEVREAIGEAERLMTPWFVHEIIYEKMENKIQKWARAELYTASGKIISKYEKVQ